MRAVIYARFSSEKQTENSIDAQLRACKEYAERKNLKIVKIRKPIIVTRARLTTRIIVGLRSILSISVIKIKQIVKCGCKF